MARLLRLVQSFAGAAAFPLKSLGAIVGTIILPYLFYAFLGGFGLALSIIGIIWGLVWLSKKKSTK